MSAPVPAVRIPSPRRPVGVAVPSPRAATGAAVVIPAPRRPADRAGDGARPADRPVPATGRHRAAARGRAGSPATRSLRALARAGSLTTLAAMLVLAAAVAGLADGTAPTGPAAEVATSSLR